MMTPSLVSPTLVLFLAACGGNLGESAPAQREPSDRPDGLADVFDEDADADGYGVSVDCDDHDATVHPDAEEADNLVDDDCDGWVDEDFVVEGDVVISEINRQSRFGGSLAVAAGNWFELANVSDREIDLANWVVVRTTSASTRSFQVDPAMGLTIPAGERVVFCETDLYEGSAVAYPLACDYVWSDATKSPYYAGTYHVNTFHLAVSHDKLRVGLEGSRTTARFVDDVEWFYDATDGYWPAAARYSMSLDDTWLDAVRNNDLRAWCSTTVNAAGKLSNNNAWRWYDTPATNADEYGTPGAANYSCPTDVDWDGDGYASEFDCDDTNTAINPGAAEMCDGVDNNCDAVVDTDAMDRTLYFLDADADGFGGDTTQLSCTAMEGWTTVDGDCSDSDPSVNPGSADACDGVDVNCDGLDEPLKYMDADADSFGDAGNAVFSCLGEPWLVDDTTDCDDTNAGVNPAAVEHCDGTDEDCDTMVDDDPVDPIGYFLDDDADGFGGDFAFLACAGEALPTTSDDCDDTDATVNPGAPETCDGADENCDGLVDNDAIDQVERFADADLDGFGAGTLARVCDGTGWSADGTDCDDTLAAVYPGAAELRDGFDNDCDVTADEGLVSYGELVITEVNKQSRFGGTALVWAGSWVEVYNTSDIDLDLSNWTFSHTGPVYTKRVVVDPADNVVVPAHDYAVFCETTNYEGSATAAWPLYCDYVIGDPTKPSTYEGVYHNNKLHLYRDYAIVELGLDDAVIDDVNWRYDSLGYWPRDARFSLSLDPAYFDPDANDDAHAWCSITSDAAGKVHDDEAWRWYDNPTSTKDEHGTPGYANYDCPVGPDADADGVEDALDCSPDDATVHPGAVEVECDGVDQDCDGLDTCTIVDDCNGVDDDGDGTTDEDAAWTWYWQDADSDGYPDVETATYACAPFDSTWTEADPTGGTDDCNDGDGSIFPGATEVECDSIDQDCDGVDSCTVEADSGDFYAAFGAENPNGQWSYGWAMSADGSDLTRFDIYSEELYPGLDVWWPSTYPDAIYAPVFVRSPEDAVAWSPDGGTRWPARSVSLHPGAIGESAVLRWTAASDVVCDLDVTFTAYSWGHTSAGVYQSGTWLGGGAVEGETTANVVATVSMAAGDTLELTVGADGPNLGDTTGISGTWTCASDSPTYAWTYVRVDDCAGGDIGGTTGSSTPSEGECSAATAGTSAVCWDGVSALHPSGVWCTYKSTPAAECTGGIFPGYLYTCAEVGP